MLKDVCLCCSRCIICKHTTGSNQFHDSTHGIPAHSESVIENVKFLKGVPKSDCHSVNRLVKKSTRTHFYGNVHVHLQMFAVLYVRRTHMQCFGLTGKSIAIKSKDEMKTYFYFERKLCVAWQCTVVDGADTNETTSTIQMLDSKFYSTKFTIFKMWNSPNSIADKVRQLNGDLNMHTICETLHCVTPFAHSAMQTNKQTFISTANPMTWWRKKWQQYVFQYKFQSLLISKVENMVDPSKKRKLFPRKTSICRRLLFIFVCILCLILSSPFQLQILHVHSLYLLPNLPPDHNHSK